MTPALPPSETREARDERARSVSIPRPTDGIGAALRSVYLCAMDGPGRDFDALLRRLD